MIEQILRALVDPSSPPQTIGALEKALNLRFDDTMVKGGEFGSFSVPSLFAASRAALSEDIASLSVKYRFDIDHDRPPTSIDDLRARSVLELTVDFARGRPAIEARLHDRFGAARAVPGHRAYGLWFVSARPEEGVACSVSHYEKIPDWALDAPDPAIREKFLLDLFAATRAAEALTELAGVASAPPARSGIANKGSSARRVDLELAPPIAALELARLLGLPNTIGQSTDVHMSSWRLMHVTGATEYGPQTAPPTLGRWNLFAYLEGRPTGGEVAGHRGGPTGRQQVGPADLVRFFSIGPD